jgi:hypothetical protein
MSRKAEVGTAIASLGCALAIGFIMQQGEVAEQRYGSADATPASSIQIVGEPPVTPVRFTEIEATPLAPLRVRSIKLTSGQIVAPPPAALFGAEIKTLADASAQASEEIGNDLERAATKEPADCPLEISADPTGGAMLSLDIKATCLAGSEVIITHDVLTFSDVLSDTGELTVFVPALSEKAVVEAVFATGEKAQARAEVKSLSLYDRVLVQWRGAANMRMSLGDADAARGEAGHVWAVATEEMPQASESQEDYLSSTLGKVHSVSQVSEVYTFPETMSASDRAVDLTVETEITADNCGQEIPVKAARIFAGNKMRNRDLTLSVPGCDEIGNILVLNNFLQDLTLASK